VLKSTVKRLMERLSEAALAWQRECGVPVDIAVVTALAAVPAACGVAVGIPAAALAAVLGVPAAAAVLCSLVAAAAGAYRMRRLPAALGFSAVRRPEPDEEAVPGPLLRRACARLGVPAPEVAVCDRRGAFGVLGVFFPRWGALGSPLAGRVVVGKWMLARPEELEFVLAHEAACLGMCNKTALRAAAAGYLAGLCLLGLWLCLAAAVLTGIVAVVGLRWPPVGPLVGPETVLPAWLDNRAVTTLLVGGAIAGFAVPILARLALSGAARAGMVEAGKRVDECLSEDQNGRGMC